MIRSWSVQMLVCFGLGLLCGFVLFLSSVWLLINKVHSTIVGFKALQSAEEPPQKIVTSVARGHPDY